MEIAKTDHNDQNVDDDKAKDSITQQEQLDDKQYNLLQQRWDGKKGRKQREKVKSHAAETIKLKTMHDILKNSPGHLMMSTTPQNSKPKSLSGGSWKVHTNELAVMEEIRREIKAAIESGKIKDRRGRRRLFEDGAEFSEEDMCSACFSSVVQDSGQSTLVTSQDGHDVSCQDWKSDLSSSSVSHVDEKLDLVKDTSFEFDHKKRCKFSKFWAVIGLIVVALQIITSSFDMGHGNTGNRVILVPT